MTAPDQGFDPRTQAEALASLRDRIEDALLELESRAKRDYQEHPVQNMIVACQRCLDATPKGKILNLRNRTRASAKFRPPNTLQNTSGA